MISVCIATYNGEKFLKQQIDSILIQLGSNDEIIISDDCSTDKTLEILKDYQDPRIKIYSELNFKNPIFNFENALSQANGDFIFLSDQDDLWHKDKVNIMIAQLKNYDVVVCDHSLIDEHNNLLEDSYFRRVKSGSGIIHNLKKNTYYGCCMAFRKEIINLALPFPRKIPMHDIWLGFVTDMFFKAKFVDIPLTMYRKHTNNVSNASEKHSNYSIKKKIIHRLNILRYVPLLILRKITIK